MSVRTIIAIAFGALIVGVLAGLAGLGKLPSPRLAAGDPATSTATSHHKKSTPQTQEDNAAYNAYDAGKYLTALKLAEEAAKQGDPQAHTLIARIYEEGSGIPKDEGTAARWYARAAELGDVPAMLAIGNMLADGRGVKKDRKLAAEMYEKAAMTGDPVANYNLGILFLKGDGKPENPHRAANHIRYAAEKGIAAAQYDMAALYQNGAGVPFDALKAARWMSKAAAQGHAAAQYDYAVMLLAGKGLKHDEPHAIEHLKSAAEKGLAPAQNRLGHVYKEGVGGEPNLLEAAKWRIIAKAGGVTDDKFDLFVKAMPDTDREKAEKAAAEWRDKKRVFR